MGEYWVYRHGKGAEISYLFTMEELDSVELMRRLEPYFEKGKAYAYDEHSFKVAEYPDAVFRFGVTFASKEIAEPGYCYRCGSKGIMYRTALICPRCRDLLGGF